MLFQIAVSFAVGGSAAMGVAAVLWHAAAQFGLLAGGGAVAGALIAAVVMLVRSRITDPVLESVVALVTPCAVYVAGTALRVSGVTAVIVAGLIIGARRARFTTATPRLQVHAVYQTVIFLLESVVFSLIGLELPTLASDLGHSGPWPLVALAIAATLILTRVLWVFPLWAGSQWRQGRRPSWTVPAVVSWARTRGVVPLAAALSIPLTTGSGASLPQRDLLLVLAVTVIVIALVVQGLTLESLVRRTAVAQPAASTQQEETAARLRLAEAGITRLGELAASEERASGEARRWGRAGTRGTRVWAISAATRQRLPAWPWPGTSPARQRNGLTGGSSPAHCCSCRSWHWSGCGLASLQVCREAWSAMFMILQLAGLEAHNGAGHKPAHRRR